MKLNTIKEAIEDLKNNKVIIVVDDENRENEGDFIYPAEIISPDIVNFMATHGRGLICVPLTSKRCKYLIVFSLLCALHHEQAKNDCVARKVSVLENSRG